MVDRPTKRQPVAIAVIEAGTTIRLVSGNHDHGIATSASWYEKRNLAGPLAGGCSKLPASSTAPSKRMRWSETRLTSVCVSASNVHQPIRSSMTSLNFASTHLPTNNTRPAAYDRAQGRYESSPGPLDWIVACVLSCVHACSENSEGHPRDLRWANGL